MSRDYWMTRRKTPIIDKLKQTITIPALIAECGPTQGSLYITTDLFAAPYNSVAVPISMSNGGVALDIYAKILPGTAQKIMRLIDPTAGFGLELAAVTSTSLRFTIIHSGGTQNNVFTCNYLSEWHRFTLVYDDNAGIGYFYLDNVLLVTGAATGGQITFPNDAQIILGNTITETKVNGYFNEIRVWDQYMTYDEVLNTKSYRGTYDAANNFLDYYVRLRAISNTPILGGGVFSTASLTNAASSTGEYPDIKYGASFIVAEYEFDAGHNVSLQWPVDPPADTTGMLVVHWFDSEGETQRRLLWDLDGVDIAEFPALYAGENMGNNISLELWNIDGAATCVLPEALILYISYCTNPTTSYDRTHQAVASSPTADTTLAIEFPATFPLVFNTQQTY